MSVWSLALLLLSAPPTRPPFVCPAPPARRALVCSLGGGAGGVAARPLRLTDASFSFPLLVVGRWLGCIATRGGEF